MPTRNVNLTAEQDALRAQLKAGLDALERGEFTEIADADIEAALDGLSAAEAR